MRHPTEIEAATASALYVIDSKTYLAAPYRDARVGFFGGRVRTKARADSTHSCSASSESLPAASTNIIDFIGLPVKSIGRVCGRRSPLVTASGGSRSIRSVFKTPQHMWPLIMKASPPKLFLAENPTV